MDSLLSLIEDEEYDPVSMEVLLDEMSKENSMLRSINEMILCDAGSVKPGKQSQPDDVIPLRTRIQELELFLFNLGSEHQTLQNSFVQVSRQLQVAKDRVRCENTASQVMRTKVQVLSQKLQEFDQMESKMTACEKKIVLLRKTLCIAEKDKSLMKKDLDECHSLVTTKSNEIVVLSAKLKHCAMDQAKLQTALARLSEIDSIKSGLIADCTNTDFNTFENVSTSTTLIKYVDASMETILSTNREKETQTNVNNDILSILTCGVCKCAAQATLFPCGHGSCFPCFDQLAAADTRLSGVMCRECDNGLPITRICTNWALIKLYSLLEIF